MRRIPIRRPARGEDHNNCGYFAKFDRKRYPPIPSRQLPRVYSKKVFHIASVVHEKFSKNFHTFELFIFTDWHQYQN